MKDNGDNVIYLYLKPHNDFLFTTGSFSDEKKYPINQNEDLTNFLRYLTSVKACEIIGNIFDNADFVKNNTLTKDYYELLEISEKTSTVDNLINKSLINIHNYINDMLSLYKFSDCFLNSCSLKNISFYEKNNVNKDIFKVSIILLFQQDNISDINNRKLQSFIEDVFYSIDTNEYPLYHSNDTFELLPSTHFKISSICLENNIFELTLPIRLRHL